MNDSKLDPTAIPGVLPAQNHPSKQDCEAPRSEHSHEDIARRAHQIFETKGHQHGHCEKNWHQAEAELRNELYPHGPVKGHGPNEEHREPSRR